MEHRAAHTQHRTAVVPPPRTARQGGAQSGAPDLDSPPPPDHQRPIGCHRGPLPHQPPGSTNVRAASSTHTDMMEEAARIPPQGGQMLRLQQDVVIGLDDVGWSLPPPFFAAHWAFSSAPLSPVCVCSLSPSTTNNNYSLGITTKHNMHE